MCALINYGVCDDDVVTYALMLCGVCDDVWCIYRWCGLVRVDDVVWCVRVAGAVLCVCVGGVVWCV